MKQSTQHAMTENEEYQRGYEDGLSAERDSLVDAYYDGYRRGRRDVHKEAYSYGLYTGVLIGSVTTICCGFVMYLTGAKSLTSGILAKIR